MLYSWPHFTSSSFAVVFRQQKRSSSSTAPLSHSDCFTYHLVIMELIGVLGLFLIFIAIYQEYDPLLTPGFVLTTFTWYGQTWIHLLTCVERFLAVVHPIMYMKLRSERAIRVRNFIIACIWMLCFLGTGFLAISYVLLIFDYSLLTFCITGTVFCSISVLRALTQPGPGEQAGGRERIDQSKQKALYTILSILGALILRFIGSLLWTIIFTSQISYECLIMTCTAWLNIPSSLVLPLLFLNKAGQLLCFKK